MLTLFFIYEIAIEKLSSSVAFYYLLNILRTDYNTLTNRERIIATKSERQNDGVARNLAYLYV